MKIGIDTFGCNHSQSGNGSYLLNFISNYSEQKDIELELFGFEIDRFTYIKNAQASYASVDIKDNLPSIRKWHKINLNSFITKNKYDLVIYPGFEHVLPLHVNKKIKAVAIMNSYLTKILQTHKKSYNRRIIKALKKASLIIAGTHFIKNDLLKYGISEKKINIIPNGIDHKLFSPFVNTNEEYININPFAIKKPYFVYGSSIRDKSKKHLELIKAFEIFKKNTLAPHRLVLAGANENLDSTDDYVSQVLNAVKNSDFSSDIFITGYFPHESFATLYAGAEACLFPSVSEGVGLPVLEAMACGIPVLCSKEGALEEVAGDVAMYFNSDDVSEIAYCMQKIIEDNDLRLKMIESGLKKSAPYNWSNTVLQTFEIIKSLYLY